MAESTGKPQQGRPDDFEVNRPMRGAKEGYTWRWFDLDREYSKIISNMGDKRFDQRIPRLTRHMISTITDDNIKLYLFNLYDKAMDDIRKDKTLKTEQERADLIMDICDVFVGEVWSFYDQFAGVTHRLRVGNANPPPGTEEPVESDAIDLDGEVAGAIESPVGVPGRYDVIYEEEYQ
jgi:hypothetical protein